MTEPTKKISFGFTKSKPMQPKKVLVKSDIQYIDCLESKSIKIKGGEAFKEKQELIIPVNANRPISMSIETKTSKDVECTPDELTGAGSAAVLRDSLEAIAVKELLEESQKVKHKDESKVLAVEMNSERKKAELEKEPTLDDYESIPVADFGLAMLRGMGWTPDKGIGKHERVVVPTFPELRTKGMGLGADKQTATHSAAAEAQELVLQRGSYVQVVAGTHKNTYGQVQSLDEDVGRVIIKAALGGESISVNEAMIKVVTKDEYNKSSRVLNLSQYQELTKKEERGGRRQEHHADHKRHKREEYSETNGSFRSE